MRMACTIAVLEKGAMLEAGRAHVLRRTPRPHRIVSLPLSA